MSVLLTLSDLKGGLRGFKIFWQISELMAGVMFYCCMIMDVKNCKISGDLITCFFIVAIILFHDHDLFAIISEITTLNCIN